MSKDFDFALSEFQVGDSFDLSPSATSRLIGKILASGGEFYLDGKTLIIKSLPVETTPGSVPVENPAVEIPTPAAGPTPPAPVELTPAEDLAPIEEPAPVDGPAPAPVEEQPAVPAPVEAIVAEPFVHTEADDISAAESPKATRKPRAKKTGDQ